MHGGEKFVGIERFDEKCVAPNCMAVSSAPGSLRPVMTMTRVVGRHSGSLACTSRPVICSIQISRTTSGTEFAYVGQEIIGVAKGAHLKPIRG